MGAEGQLLAIARIRNRYRMMACVHSEYYYDYDAVRQVAETLRIIRSSAASLRPKLLKAQTLDWAVAEKHKNGEESAWMFPITTTALIVGAGQHLEDRYACNIHTLSPFSMLSMLDDNEGIQVLDITNPDEPCYGFVSLEGIKNYTRRQKRGEDFLEYHKACHIPAKLNAVENARDYLEEQEASNGAPHPIKAEQYVMECLQTPLVESSAIASAFPNDVLPRTDGADFGGPNLPRAERMRKHLRNVSLRDMSLENVIDVAFKHDPQELGWLEFPKKLPDFSQRVLARMHECPSLIDAPSGIPLLKLAMQGQHHWDLSWFPSIKAHQVVDLVTSFDQATHIISEQSSSEQGCSNEGVVLSLPVMPGMDENVLRSILASGKIAELHLSDTPDISIQRIMVIVSEYTLKMITHPAMFAASHALATHWEDSEPIEFPATPFGQSGSLPISQVVYFSRFLRTCKHETPLPKMNANPPGLPWSKFVGHADYSRVRVNEPWWWLGLTIILMSLKNTFMSVERLISLPEIVRSFSADHNTYRTPFNMAYMVTAAASKLALATDHRILPLPPTVYADYKAMTRNTLFGQPQAELPAAGQWSLYICQDQVTQSKESQQSALRYAFVTVDENGAMMACDIQQFLLLVAPSPPRNAEGFLEALRECHGPGQVATDYCDQEEVDEMVAAATKYNDLVEKFDAMVSKVFTGQGRTRGFLS